MKLLYFIIGCVLGIILMGVIGTEKVVYKPMQPTNKVLFILESVEADSTLQRMIIDPTYRLRVKEAEKKLK